MEPKKLGFGLMRLPITEEGNPQSIDQELVNKMVNYYLEKGFNYFDTGYPYHQGMSEVAAKKALVERCGVKLLDQILTEHPEMEYVQLQINYIDWDNESI